MMICGSCGMRMDGARRARLQGCGCTTIVEAGHVPVISAMGNLPIVKDLVVDMEPFWEKIRAIKPWLEPGYDRAAGEKEHVVSQAADERRSTRSRSASSAAAASPSATRWSPTRTSSGPAALAKGMRFVGDPRDAGDGRAARAYYSAEHGIWDCTRCYFCNERCPKGVDPRDAIAKLGAEAMQARDRPRHGREAREVVRHLGEDDRLAARDRARAEDAGRSSRRSSRSKFAMGLAAQGQGAAAVPAARRGGREGGARALRPRQGAGPRRRRRASSRARRRSPDRAPRGVEAADAPVRARLVPKPYLPGEEEPRRCT